MSKDKYTSIFLRKIEAVVIIILQRFCNAREKMFTNSLLFAEYKCSLIRHDKRINISLLYQIQNAVLP